MERKGNLKCAKGDSVEEHCISAGEKNQYENIFNKVVERRSLLSTINIRNKSIKTETLFTVVIEGRLGGKTNGGRERNIK